MKNFRKRFLSIGASLIAACMILTGCSSRVTNSSSSFSNANVLTAPTDFKFDMKTGNFSFTANDKRAGYYYVRIFSVANGAESNTYTTSSSRIDGTTVGNVTGKLDVSKVVWGLNYVKLVTFSAAGTQYTAPSPVTLKYEVGADQVLERPEMMAIASGNQVEFVFDWWSLCDYHSEEYMPKIKLSIYSDAACTQSVKSDTYDTSDLLKTLSMTPTGLAYIWGFATSGLHLFKLKGTNMFNPGQTSIVYQHDNFPYTLSAGTYYATCQALTKYDFTKDSQVSTVVKFTLTNDEPTTKYTASTTALWADPDWVVTHPGANPGKQPKRVDCYLDKPMSVKLVG